MVGVPIDVAEITSIRLVANLEELPLPPPGRIQLGYLPGSGLVARFPGGDYSGLSGIAPAGPAGPQGPAGVAGPAGPAGPAGEAGEGGGLTLLGPYRVSFDDPNLGGDGVVYGPFLPEGALLVRLFAFVLTAWADVGSVRLDVGIANGDPANGDTSPLKQYENVDLGPVDTADYAIEARPRETFSGGLFDAVVINSGTIKVWATTTQSVAALAGAADLYALVIAGA